MLPRRYDNVTSGPPRMRSIQSLRAVAALFVLFYHLSFTLEQLYSVDGRSFHPFGAFRQFGFVGVDLFFVISGVVMVVTCYDRLGDPQQVGPFLWRRAVRIYPLYWLVTLAVVGFAWCVPQLASGDKLAIDYLMKSLLLLPQPRFPCVGVGWSLTYEMYFYCVFALLLAVPRRYLLPLLTVWAAATVACYPFFRVERSAGIDSLIQLPLYASPMIVEFVCGCVLGWLFCCQKLQYGWLWLIVGIAFTLILGYFAGSKLALDTEYGLTRVCVFGFGATLVTCGMLALEGRGIVVFPRLFERLGDASYSIYLTHMYVLYVCTGLFRKFSPSVSYSSSYIFSLTVVSICLACGLATYYFVERPLLSLLRSPRRTKLPKLGAEKV